jgi:hypothetical protein
MNKTKVEPGSSAGPELQSHLGINRRSFLGTMGSGAATVAAAALADPNKASAQSNASANSGRADAPEGVTQARVIEASSCG